MTTPFVEIKLDPNQSDYQNYYQQYILYYCNSVNNDKKLYNDSDLSDVCTITLDETTKKIEISNWLLPYPKPTNELLISYSKNTIMDWFDKFYLKAKTIKDYQFPILSTADLIAIRADRSMINMLAFAGTLKILKSYNGNAWVPYR